MPVRSAYNRPLHTIALATAIATFPLIFMGGLVTSHQAGMSVPDWPNSYGYNMFTFPPSQWVGGIFYEHTHRLAATVVGMLSIVLTIVAWRTEPRAWVRWLCTGVLGAVIIQGVLGGLRVVLVKLDLAIVHACAAQACFCLTAFACVVTSRWWNDIADCVPPVQSRALNRLIAAAVACVIAIYLQLIVGATMRHYNAGLAIADLPLAYGHLLPPTNNTALDAINTQRVWSLHLKPVTLWQVWLHFGHRIGAVVVTLAILSLAWMILRRHRSQRALVVPAVLLLVLLAGQITLGVLTVLWQKPADIASLHVAVGALVLLTSVVLATRAVRLRHISVAQPPPAVSWREDESQPRAAVPHRDHEGSRSEELVFA